MFSRCPLRIGAFLLLFAIPYLCDVVSSDELTDNLLVHQVTILEADLDDEKATETVPSIDIIVVGPNAPSTLSAGVVVTNPSFRYDSPTILAVSGCRPPPVRL